MYMKGGAATIGRAQFSVFSVQFSGGPAPSGSFGEDNASPSWKKLFDVSSHLKFLVSGATSVSAGSFEEETRNEPFLKEK